MRYTRCHLRVPLLFLISSSSSQQRESNLSLPVYEDADAYEVYSATLPMDTSYQDSRTVVILQSVPPSEWPIGSPREALHVDSDFTKTFAPIFDSFDKANQESKTLERHFSISVSAQRLQWICRSGSMCRENTGGRGASPERKN